MALPHLATFPSIGTELTIPPLDACQSSHKHLPGHVSRQLERSGRRSDRHTRAISCLVRTHNSKRISALERSDFSRNSLHRMLPRQQRRGATRVRTAVTVSAVDGDTGRGRGGAGSVDAVASQEASPSPFPPVSGDRDHSAYRISMIRNTEVQRYSSTEALLAAQNVAMMIRHPKLYPSPML